MMLLALFFSCVISESFACSDDHCKDPALARELMELRFLPNGRQLGALCPKILTFLECEKDFVECPGLSLEEMTASSDQTIAGKAKLLLNGIRLVRDVCDEDSSLHDDYVGSVDCIRGYFEDAGTMCADEAIEPVEKFFDELYPNEEDVSDEDFKEALDEFHCLKEALEAVCVIKNLGKTCGKVAQKTILTALGRLEGALHEKLCTDVKDAADLKSRFLDFLELEDEERREVQDIFDLLKRRR